MTAPAPVLPMQPAPQDRALHGFVHACSVLTGFDAFDLQGTGQVHAYRELLQQAVGEATVAALIARLEDLPPREPARDRAIRARVLADTWLGPVARSLIQLWYLGTWVALPDSWHRQYGGSTQDATRIPSPQAYVEGLVWRAIGAHPMGAKPDGFGAWAAPPAPFD